jgi:drug/metabolite transporter (DMT)-like permease
MKERATMVEVMKEHRLLGAAQIIFAGIGFGFLGVFGKLAFETGLTVGELLTWRFFAAGLILWLGLGLAGRALLRITGRQLFVCALLGIFGYAVFSTLYFETVKGVSVSLASLLLYTFPVMVTVGSRVFLREHVTPRQWLALPAAAAGLAALLWGEIDVRSWAAVLFGLGSALCYALYILANRKWQNEISPITSGVYVITFSAFALLLWHQPDPAKLTSFNATQIGCILGLAVISTIGPMILFLSGLQRLSGAEASVLSTIEPVTAAVLSALIFHERLGLGHFAGGVGILAAVGLTVGQRRSTLTATES